MSFWDKFKPKTRAEKIVENTNKSIKKEVDRSLRIAECKGDLSACKDFYEKSIFMSRSNIIKRRAAYMSDAAEMERIRDAIIGYLAVEEADFELDSIKSSSDMNRAEDLLKKVLKHMYRLDNTVSIRGKELREALQGEDLENTQNILNFSERANLVDTAMIEDIIGGLSVEDCLRKVKAAQEVTATSGKSQSRFDGNSKILTDPAALAKLEELADKK